MPIFEYKCRQCGQQFEVLVLRRDERPTCAKCGAADVEKLASGFAVSGGGPSIDSPGLASGGGCGGGGGFS